MRFVSELLGPGLANELAPVGVVGCKGGRRPVSSLLVPCAAGPVLDGAPDPPRFSFTPGPSPGRSGDHTHTHTLSQSQWGLCRRTTVCQCKPQSILYGPGWVV